MQVDNTYADVNENLAIQQIKKDLMSYDFEAQPSPPVSAPAMSLPPFNTSVGSVRNELVRLVRDLVYFFPLIWYDLSSYRGTEES